MLNYHIKIGLFPWMVIEYFLKFNQSERIISWLPGAHVFGQALDNHYWVRRALHMYIVDHPLNTVDYAKEIQPHLFFSFQAFMRSFSNLRSAINSKPILKYGLKIPLLSGLLKRKLRGCRFWRCKICNYWCSTN